MAFADARCSAWRPILPLLVAAALLAAPPTAAQEAGPDWPCIQRLVPELTAAQMWAGPSPAAAKSSPGGDDQVAQLAHRLASRSMPVDEAQAAIDQFAESLPPEERDAQLARLFHEVLPLINRERSRIIAGIERYARNQQALAEKIRQDNEKLGDLQPGTTPDADTEAMLNERHWDVRVFEDRRRMLSQVCEQPVLLEQRAFSLSRAMQAELEPK